MSTIKASDFLHLSVPERLQLVEDIWDSIAADTVGDAGGVPITDAQRHEILRRSAAHRSDPDTAVPLDEALERIERSLG